MKKDYFNYTMKDLYKLASAIARYIAKNNGGFKIGQKAPKDHYFITVKYDYILCDYFIEIKHKTFFIVSFVDGFESFITPFDGNGNIVK